MTPPTRYLWRMLAFLTVVAVVTALLAPALADAFAANPGLNAVIVGVLVLGIAWNLRQVLALRPEVAWLEAFWETGAPDVEAPPRLLAPMASMLATRRGGTGGQGARLSLSAPAMRSLLDGLASRLDETRELSRYMTGLLIFLGLLGTFWGLLLTIGAVSEVIAGMGIGAGDLNQMFNQLKSGLAQPLRGMGTAFSSSMLGLAGALVLGFLDLTAGQAQNRFVGELEEGLAGLTRLSSGALADGEGGSVPAYVQALLEQTAENLEALQRTFARGEEGRVAAGNALLTLTDRLSVLADQMRAGQQVMARVAEGQAALAPALQRLAEDRGGQQGALDEASRAHLRNLELYLARLVEESAQGRAQATAEIRHEIKVLSRTLAALAEGPPG